MNELFNSCLIKTRNNHKHNNKQLCHCQPTSEAGSAQIVQETDILR